MTSARATIIDNIGATGNTGGSATAGTVMAKLNAIITKLNSSSGSSAIKSIQRGVADPANYKNSSGYALTQWTININAVNPNKTIVILKDSYIAVKGGSSSYGENGMHGAYLISLSATSFTIGYNGSNENMSYGYTYGYPVSWQVIEFV